MNKKLLIFGLIVLLVVGIAGCSGMEEDEITPKSLYVEVSNGGGEANIFLLKNGNIIDYRQASNTAKFTDLSYQNYQVAVGREGYSLFKESVTVEGEKKLDVDLKSADSPPVEIEVSAINLTGDPIYGFEAQALRDGNIEDTASDNNTGSATLKVWAGMIYDYKAIKGEYSYEKSDLVYTGTDNSFSLEVSLLENINGQGQIFSAVGDKTLNLGTLAKSEIAVVGVASLDLTTGYGSAGETYSPTLEVTYDSSNDASALKSVDTQKTTDQNSIEMQSQITEFYGNQPQVDAELREREKEIFNEYGTEGFKTKSSTSTQQLQSLLQKGEKKDFNVPNFGGSDYDTINATLKRVEPHVYIFVDNDVSISSDKLDILANQFNDNIFDTNMDSFASYSYSYFDVDGNGRPIVLLTPAGDQWLGLFNPSDYTDDSSSNKADMFYVNADAVKDYPSMDTILGTLAHEFQHLIYFNEKFIDYYENDKQWIEDTWANEGLSMLAMRLNGYYDYNTPREGNYLKDTNGESLLYWNQELKDYGASGLFMYSLYDKFGIDLVKEIVSNCEDPVNIISNYSAKSFEDHFLDWMLTNHITVDGGMGDDYDQYKYPFSLPETLEVESISSSGDYTFDVNSSAIKYYEIEGDGSEVQLNISDLNEKTGVVIYRK